MRKLSFSRCYLFISLVAVASVFFALPTSTFADYSGAPLIEDEQEWIDMKDQPDVAYWDYSTKGKVLVKNDGTVFIGGPVGSMGEPINPPIVRNISVGWLPLPNDLTIKRIVFAQEIVVGNYFSINGGDNDIEYASGIEHVKITGQSGADYPRIFSHVTYPLYGLKDLQVEGGSLASLFNFAAVPNLQEVENWDYSQVTNMRGMFSAATLPETFTFTNISAPKATDVSRLFFRATGARILDVSGFSAPIATSAEAMFSRVHAEELIANDLDLRSVTNVNEMFEGESSSNPNYPAEPSKIEASRVDLRSATSLYRIFHSTKAQEIPDVSSWKLDSLTTYESLYYGAFGVKSIDLRWLRDDLKGNLRELLGGTQSLEEAIGIENLVTNTTEDISYLLSSSGLPYVDTTAWDLSNVTSLERVFYGMASENLTIDVTGWQFNPNLDNLGYVFAHSEGLNEIIGLDSWDVSNINTMSSLFAHTNLADLKGTEDWDVSNVVVLDGAFSGLKRVTSLDLSKWDLPPLYSIHTIFSDSTALKTIKGIESWNVSNVAYFSYVFMNTHSLTMDLDLSGWTPTVLYNTSSMFAFSGVRSLNLSGFGALPEYADSMFVGTRYLRELIIPNLKVHPDQQGDPILGWNRSLTKLVIGEDFSPSPLRLSYPTLAHPEYVGILRSPSGLLFDLTSEGLVDLTSEPGEWHLIPGKGYFKFNKINDVNFGEVERGKTLSGEIEVEVTYSGAEPDFTRPLTGTLKNPEDLPGVATLSLKGNDMSQGPLSEEVPVFSDNTLRTKTITIPVEVKVSESAPLGTHTLHLEYLTSYGKPNIDDSDNKAWPNDPN